MSRLAVANAGSQIISIIVLTRPQECAVTQISDGQPQVGPCSTLVASYGASSASGVSPATFTGAAVHNSPVVALVGGLAALIALA